MEFALLDFKISGAWYPLDDEDHVAFRNEFVNYKSTEKLV